MDVRIVKGKAGADLHVAAPYSVAESVELALLFDENSDWKKFT